MNRIVKQILLAGVFVLAYVGIRYLYFLPRYGSGDRVPEISATLSTGQHFELSQLRDHYVLLDFWGSWCGPCIRDQPEMKALYAKYHTANFEAADGLEIVSIAIENDTQRWRRALEILKPVSPYQILDTTTSLRFFNGKISEQFGVNRLPMKFLINGEGKVVGANWSLAEIAEYLNAHLKA